MYSHGIEHVDREWQRLVQVLRENDKRFEELSEAQIAFAHMIFEVGALAAATAYFVQDKKLVEALLERFTNHLGDVH